MQENRIFTGTPYVLLIAGAVLSVSLAAFAQTEKILYNFSGVDSGEVPASNLLSDGAGGFYGTAEKGGIANCPNVGGTCGIFFHLSRSAGVWAETGLYNFQNTPDASFPDYELTQDSAGNIYGVSILGGLYNNGTVFELSPPAQSGGAWTESVLYSFTGQQDGGTPIGGVVFGWHGALYGTTLHGGAADGDQGAGGIYQLLPPSQPGGAWTETMLYEFPQITTEGQGDMRLTADSSGRLFGTNQQGGMPFGIVYVFIPPAKTGGTWTFKDIYAFKDNGDGSFPLAGVILDKLGNVYGTSNGLPGTVFQLAPPEKGSGEWTFNLLYTFRGSPDGMAPQTRLTMDGRGNLYGTTYAGGDVNRTNCAETGCGTVFEVSPINGGGWEETVLHAFKPSNDGQRPGAPVTYLDGILYGTTLFGGTADGTAFAIAPK
jgi:hypothetical protein